MSDYQPTEEEIEELQNEAQEFWEDYWSRRWYYAIQDRIDAENQAREMEQE